MDVARRERRRRGLPVLWRFPDDLWELIRVTLPAVELRPSGGRPWIAPRRIVDGVLFKRHVLTDGSGVPLAGGMLERPSTTTLPVTPYSRTSNGAPRSLTRSTMNFAGFVLLAFRPTT